MKKATQKEIREFMELKERMEQDKARYDELREMLIANAEQFGEQDKKNPNKRTFSNGDCLVSVTHRSYDKFSQTELKNRYPDMYEECKLPYEDDIVKATEK